MLNIYVDADACPVKKEIFRIAARHNLQVYLVSNCYLAMAVDQNVHKIKVDADPDAADDWIEAHVEAGDVVVTTDILLAGRCLKKDARVVNSTGKIFTDDNIGIAKAMRDLHAHLREAGLLSNNNAAFLQHDRSRFLQALEEIIQSIKNHC